jgi:hypothetical protein
VTTGIVSEMNGQLMMDGFRSLQSVLEKKQPILTRDMLMVADEDRLSDASFSSAITSTSYDVLTPLSLARLHASDEELRRTHDEMKTAQLLSRLENKEGKGRGSQDGMSDKNVSKIDTQEKDKSSVHSVLIKHATPQSSLAPASFASSFQMRKQSRREQILALFVKGVDVSIKDIAARIKGCSEKTIQRELNALLYDNVIERIGEKRWSRYILR